MTATERQPVPRHATPQPGGLTPALSATGSTQTSGQASSTLRGGRLDEPELPRGQLQLQPPPQIDQAEGASGVLMNAIPMLGSLGSIVLVATMAGTSAAGEQTQRAELARALLDRLPEAQREVFILFELEQLSGEEIAAELGIPLGTVRSRLRRARDAFRREVTEALSLGDREAG